MFKQPVHTNLILFLMYLVFDFLMAFLNLLKSIDLQNLLLKSRSLNPVIQRFINLFCVTIVVAYQCYNLAQDFGIQNNQMNNCSFELC